MQIFGETTQAFEAMLAEVKNDPDQSWRLYSAQHYAQLLLVRASRACSNMARRVLLPDAQPNSNELKQVQDMLWDAAVVLSAGRVAPQQQEQVEALYRLMTKAENDGNASAAPAAAQDERSEQ